MKLFATSVLAATVAAQSAAPDEPPKPMTCNSAIIKDRKRNGIFDRYRPNGKINTCRFSEVMQQLGTFSMERAVYFIDNSKKDLVNDSMQRIIAEWRNLAGEGWERLDCGFDEIQGPTKRLSKRHVRDPVRSCEILLERHLNARPVLDSSTDVNGGAALATTLTGKKTLKM